jgi:hypothetical protein
MIPIIKMKSFSGVYLCLHILGTNFQCHGIAMYIQKKCEPSYMIFLGL